MPQDWSHHHLVFTPPSSIEQAWRLRQEPRFWHQVLRRNAAAHQQEEDDASDFVGRHGGHGHGRMNLEHPDWGMSLLAGGKAGAGVYPAKFTFDINATPDCINDYVAFTTSLAGSSTQPSIIAFDELYSTQGSQGGLCNQNGPSVKWAYHTGTGTVVTSPALSGDGAKIAYVETAAAGATLHILKWKPGATATVQGTLNAPATPDTTLTAGTAWSTCPAANSCVVNIAFGTGTQDTNSSPFYDFAADNLYVGDDKGNVHKFTGVFNGTPVEAGAPWPVAVGNKNVVNSPVFDSATSKVFVGDSGGNLYSISSTGVVITSNRVAFRSGFVDGPIVDSSAATVYAFGSADTNAAGTHAAVWQFSTGFAAGASGNKIQLGTGVAAAGNKFFDGSFDNIYFTSANSASPTGNLYVCGNPGGNATLYRIPITANVMGAPSLMAAAMSTASTTCSPVTEILNGSTDWIFVSVQSSRNTASPISCPAPAGGCIMSFNVTAGTTPTATSARAAASGGTSGIVVDNVSASAQASSLYFTYLSNSAIGATCNGVTGVGCAVKLTQSGLQ